MTLIILFFLKFSHKWCARQLSELLTPANFWVQNTTNNLLFVLYFSLNIAPKTQKYDKLEERSKHDFPLGLCITFSKLWTFFPKCEDETFEFHRPSTKPPECSFWYDVPVQWLEMELVSSSFVLYALRFSENDVWHLTAGKWWELLTFPSQIQDLAFCVENTLFIFETFRWSPFSKKPTNEFTSSVKALSN